VRGWCLVFVCVASFLSSLPLTLPRPSLPLSDSHKPPNRGMQMQRLLHRQTPKWSTQMLPWSRNLRQEQERLRRCTSNGRLHTRCLSIPLNLSPSFPPTLSPFSVVHPDERGEQDTLAPHNDAPHEIPFQTVASPSVSSCSPANCSCSVLGEVCVHTSIHACHKTILMTPRSSAQVSVLSARGHDCSCGCRLPPELSLPVLYSQCLRQCRSERPATEGALTECEQECSARTALNRSCASTDVVAQRTQTPPASMLVFLSDGLLPNVPYRLKVRSIDLLALSDARVSSFIHILCQHSPAQHMYGRVNR
jgi:hypothetical protein